MIQLSTFSFLALLEVIFVLLLAVGFLIWRHRKHASSSKAIEIVDITEEQTTPGTYLDSEAAKTQTFVDGLHDDAHAAPTDLVLRAALALRAQVLRREAEIAANPVDERDAESWTALAQQVATELGAEAFSHASAKTTAIHGEDAGSAEAIAAQQTKTIQYLKDYIAQLLEKVGHEPSPDPHITERFDQLERSNQEMSQCIAVLEDENSFLRDQIAALLKED